LATKKKNTRKRKPVAASDVKQVKDSIAAKPLKISEATPAKLADFKPVICVWGEDTFKTFGLSGKQRLRRQFARAGISEEISIENCGAHKGPIILVRADALIDQPLIEVLASRPNLILTTEAQEGKTPIAANLRGSDSVLLLKSWTDKTPLFAPTLLIRAPSELEANFWKALRKRETPYALLMTGNNQETAERRMFMGTYKGATDIITKHLWPVPAFHATRWLAPRGVTPNMVTSVAAALTALAFILFWQGYFAVGLLAAWAMTFLDTVDGKLARTTLTSSKWGDVFDHGIDLVHPPFWYWAWAIGLTASEINWSSQLFWWVIGIILAGYVLQRAIEGIAIKWLGLEIHIWRKIDTLFRQVTARRNPNLIILTLFTIIQKPDWGLIVVAVWTAICLVLHAIQLLQALAHKKQSGPLASWMTAP
jgi:phosphatidylglycerophosphate synthase